MRGTQKKLKCGWFSFSCSEDSLIMFTELLNEHWLDWKKNIEFTYCRVLKSKNSLEPMEIAFIEGAIASPRHMEKLKQIREISKKLVAVGSCAVTGLPAGLRNLFTDAQKKEVEALVTKFGALPQVLKVSEVVAVDAEVPGCPMDTKVFLERFDALVKELMFSR